MFPALITLDLMVWRARCRVTATLGDVTKKSKPEPTLSGGRPSRWWRGRGAGFVPVCIALAPSQITMEYQMISPAGNSPEFIAWHESGHAAGYWAQAIPLDYVTIVGHGQQSRPHTQPIDPTRGRYGQKILAYASGVVTGLEFNRWHLSDVGIVELLVGSSDDQFEAMGMASGKPMRMPRALVVGPGEDLERISPEVAERPFTVGGAITFWRDCERFVESLAPAIDAVAEQLVSCGQLDGADVIRLAAAAMTDRPAPWIPPWTAEE